ncbi:unnamed protein product [Owenia fusiformis]|uniref:Amine oxidase n=1 Tax=Owenia fusiformis TaxID=6347 RepID=A0A8J1TVJ8_OWEFU|nr:unnamed protein product [Owenia fusiformis]
METGIAIFLFALILTVGRAIEECPNDAFIVPHDGAKPSVFDQITAPEINAVLDYMKREFNIRVSRKANMSENFVFLMEKKPALKHELLNYIDNGGTAPVREARVGLATSTGVEEYTVGPLPAPTYHFKADNPKWRELQFTDRPPTLPSDEDGIDQTVTRETHKLKKLMKESFDGFSFDRKCGNKCLDYEYGAVLVHNNSRILWVYFVRIIPPTIGEDISHTLALQILLNITGADTDQWHSLRAYYNGQFFNSTEELAEKYDTGEVDKIFQSFNESTDTFSTLKRHTNRYTKSSRRGPTCFPQDGRRYSVDGHHVKYLNWEFDFTNRATSGPQLFDIRFNDERIVYELSLQEILLAYSGLTPSWKYHTLILDGYLQTGLFISPLAPGVDCPEGASYFNQVIYSYNIGTPIEIKNAFCIFEYTDGQPLRRHYANDYFIPNGRYKYYGGMANNALVLRSVLAVYNYDYTFDFIFYQNGVMATKIGPSGYPITEPYNNGVRTTQGFRINRDIFAPLHQHLFHFKVDIDVLGRKNRHETVTLKMKSETDILFGDNKDVFHNQYAKRNLKGSEKNTTYKFKLHKPKYFLFFNKQAKKSKWGHPRAYSIENHGASKFLYPDDWSRVGSVAWAKYQLAVSKHHDNEDQSSTVYNGMNSKNPVVNFDSYFDDENLKDEDLVAWVSIGLHHLPNSGLDSPTTTTAGNHKSFYLKPFNFFNEDPSIASKDNVFIIPGEDGENVVEENPKSSKENCAPPKDTNKFEGNHDKP